MIAVATVTHGVYSKNFVERRDAKGTKCTLMHNDVYTLTQVTSSTRQGMPDSYIFL